MSTIRMKRFSIAAALSMAIAAPVAAQTVILVRHAERADASADPPLSPAGEARASALAAATANAPPDYILTSTLQRTRLTAAPVAERHSVIVEAIAIDNGAAEHAGEIAARVRALPDDAIVLVVGHSNTIPLTARALGYTMAADMPECEYDRLTVLNLDGDRTAAIVGRYGSLTTCE